MEKKPITSRSFVRMSDGIFEYDWDTMNRLEYLLDSRKYPSMVVSLPLKDYNGYVDVEYVILDNTRYPVKPVCLEFRMYSDHFIHPLMCCFINGVPSSKEVRIVFDGIRHLIERFGQCRESLESIGWKMSEDGGCAFREVREGLEINLQRGFSKEYKTLVYNHTEERKVSEKASENVFFMTEEFKYSFRHKNTQYPYFTMVSGWDLSDSVKYVETVVIPEILKDRNLYPEYSFYTPLEHVSGLPRNLVDFMVRPMKYRAKGSGYHFWSDGEDYHTDKGLMEEQA